MAIGDNRENKRGIKSEVMVTNRPIGSPLLVTSSTKRNDWVSHRIANSENVTRAKPTKICFNMYEFSFFIIA